MVRSFYQNKYKNIHIYLLFIHFHCFLVIYCSGKFGFIYTHESLNLPGTTTNEIFNGIKLWFSHFSDFFREYHFY